MANKLTVKEAKLLIERHRTLLSNLNYISINATNLVNDIMRSITELNMQSALKQVVLDDCLNSKGDSIRNSSVERLIHYVYKYQKVRYAIDTAKTLEAFEAYNVRKNIERLKPGLGGLSWLFGGKSAKQDAELAYYELNALLNGDYGQTIPRLVDEVESVKGIFVDEAWGEYTLNPLTFSDALEHLCPQSFHAHEATPFQLTLNQLNALQNRIDKCHAVADTDKGVIKNAAEKMLANNALQILREVPIEEVNRDKAGFRVKTLRDAGFTTMADVYAASTYQLSALNGVSENAAYSLKRIAKQFLEDAREGVKIKLSADDRNKAATDLIKAIYVYRLKGESRAELDSLVRSQQFVLNDATDILKSLENTVQWLFYSEYQRSELRNAFDKVKTAVEGEYSQSVNRLTGILLTDNVIPAPNDAWNDFQEHSIEYFSILEEIVPGALGNDDRLYGLPEDLAREIQEEVVFPDGLLCTLRRYQEWGVKYILHQKKVLLGDEMGLGKTVQAIATMVSLRNTGATHFIVVCPASVVTNWCREVVRHSKLRVTKIHGAGRSQALRSWVKTGGVAVTTYETTAHIRDENVEKIDLLIVDEAHYIKNPDARRSINVRRLCVKAERLLFMTGTALENKVEEMISLIDVLQPHIASSVQGMTFMPNAPQFRNRVAPVYYRRKREDVLTELPELIESKEWCEMKPGEKLIYEQNVLTKNFMAARRLSWDTDDLKQSCKAERLLEIVEQAKAEDRKVLVFSFFLDIIRNIGGLLGSRCYGPINGSVPPPRRQEIIDAFDKAPAGSVLLAQIQSGGTGLNIQSASVVVICEPQFKPSIENQAISRAYRMGQARNVLVYRLLCINTIDEKITELLEQKQNIFDAFADKSVAAEQNEPRNVEVDDKKFGQLIEEEIKRINAEKAKAEPKDRPTEEPADSE